VSRRAHKEEIDRARHILSVLFLQQISRAQPRLAILHQIGKLGEGGASGRFAEREDAMRTILCALCAAAIVGLAAPAHAQNINLLGSGSVKPTTQDEVDAEKARNRDYQNTMKKLPDQNVKRDPWGNLRSSGTADADKKKRAGAQ
jgi:hypothetical protein